jgi:hypothetical protein
VAAHGNALGQVVDAVCPLKVIAQIIEQDVETAFGINRPVAARPVFTEGNPSGLCPHSNTGASLTASMLHVHDPLRSLCVNPGTDPGGQRGWRCPQTMGDLRDHLLYFYGFFKMVQLVFADPPFGCFHQQLRIVILVREKCVKRQANVGPFFSDLVVTNLNYFFSQ